MHRGIKDAQLQCWDVNLNVAVHVNIDDVGQRLRFRIEDPDRLSCCSVRLQIEGGIVMEPVLSRR